MIASMTGFGRAQAEAGGFVATVELRSVNSRFCEVSTRLPREVAERDTEVQRLVKDAVSRGRVSVSVQLDSASRSERSVTVDPDAVRTYRRALDEIREAAGLEDVPFELDHLLRFPDLFVPRPEDPDAGEHAWAAVRRAVQAGLEALSAMRRQEGLALRTELLGRIDRIEASLAVVEARVPLRLPEIRDRLRQRLEDLLQDARVNPERLEQEIAYIADRIDVTEECVRLRSHLDLFRQALDTPEAVGRKLNFLSQEMNREVNTIGSKANDAEVAHVVVAMKEDLEKIKEQIENVE